MMQRWLCLPLLALGLAVAPALLQAQDFPSRAIKIIVPNPPGGAGDITARLVGQKLSEVFHQPVVVENQAGASGSIAMNMLKRAAPDGYTFGVVLSLSQTIDCIQNKKASFDLADGLHADHRDRQQPGGPAGQFADPVEDDGRVHRICAQASRAKISYGSAGIGTALHLYGEVLNKVAGIKLVNVPYRGVAPAFNDLLGGHVPVAIVSLAAALQHLAWRPGAAAHRVRHQALRRAPDVPTITEVLPNIVPGRTWIGFVAPPDLPSAIQTRLNSEIVRILKSMTCCIFSARTVSKPIANSPAEFAVMIREDAKIWDEAADIAGLVPH